MVAHDAEVIHHLLLIAIVPFRWNLRKDVLNNSFRKKKKASRKPRQFNLFRLQLAIKGMLGQVSLVGNSPRCSGREDVQQKRECCLMIIGDDEVASRQEIWVYLPSIGVLDEGV